MNRKNHILTTNILVLVLFCTSINAQKETVKASIEDFDYSNIILPTLELLYENARHSASMKYYNTLRRQELSILKTTNKDWLKYFRAEALYRYGTIYTFQTGVEQSSAAPILQNDPQGWYNGGITLSIPLDDLFDRKNKSNRQKLKIRAVEYQRDAAHEQLKLEIIDLYTQIQKELDIINSMAEEFTFANLQYKESEEQFLNGRITSEVFGRYKTLRTTSLQNFLSTKYTLLNLLLKLEILTQTDIITK